MLVYQRVDPDWRLSTETKLGGFACFRRGSVSHCPSQPIGGFHSHVGTPIAGWFISWKIPI